VAVSPGGKLWAAARGGDYWSTDGGVSWHRVRALGRRWYTSVCAVGSAVLAGAKGVMYRSTDGGAHWQLAMEGLPLDPYVYQLAADLRVPGRVFAALNGDGVFRSDDAGASWRPVNTGLPLNGTQSKLQPVLMLRQGQLWLTDANGIDPESLTVDRSVRLAAMAPDGATAAYLTADEHGWAVRVVSSGARASLITAGIGAPPTALSWAPDSSLLAVVRRGSVTVSNPAGRARSWRISDTERFLGWAADRQSLLFWEGRSGRAVARGWSGEAAHRVGMGVYPTAPLPAPDGVHVAWGWGGELTISTWQGSVPTHEADIVTRVPVLRSCRVRAWSGDGSRILLACGGQVQERDLRGRLAARAWLPPNAVWAPGSNSDLLFFRRGGLWRWSPTSRARLLVPDAATVNP
jgi:photosystem II stability/assembly factor-like uncharacterized protein